MKWLAGIAVLTVLGGCRPTPAPPPNLLIEGLPVSGSLAFARAQGFTRCLDFNNGVRCRRAGLRFAGEGPYEGAVDGRGRDGAGGFRQLTLWHDNDQQAVLAAGRALAARGWTLCRTGQAERGDQNIYRKPGARFRVSIDASYWGKRRLRLMPETGEPTGRCW